MYFSQQMSQPYAPNSTVESSHVLVLCSALGWYLVSSRSEDNSSSSHTYVEPVVRLRRGLKKRGSRFRVFWALV
jgi:hypothetical protein